MAHAEAVAQESSRRIPAASIDGPWPSPSGDVVVGRPADPPADEQDLSEGFDALEAAVAVRMRLTLSRDYPGSRSAVFFGQLPTAAAIVSTKAPT